MLLQTIVTALTLGLLNKERFTFEHLKDFSYRIKRTEVETDSGEYS